MVNIKITTPAHNVMQKSIAHIQEAMNNFLRIHGGVVEENFLIDELLKHFRHDHANLSKEDERLHKEALSFVISQIISDGFEKVSAKDQYHNVWKLKDVRWEVVEDVLKALVNVIEHREKPMKQEEIITELRAREAPKLDHAAYCGSEG